jgi:hypothetical protein
MKYWIWICLLSLAGCGPIDPKTPDPDKLVVKGVLTGITMCQEDSCRTILLIEFEDGRIIKCRSEYRPVAQFWRDRVNILTIDIDDGLLEKVEFLETAESMTAG